MAASVVMQPQYQNVVVKKVEPQGKSLDLSIHVPTLTYGHEVWVVTKRTRSWIQAVEIRFLQQMDELSLRDRVSLELDKLEL